MSEQSEFNVYSQQAKKLRDHARSLNFLKPQNYRVMEACRDMEVVAGVLEKLNEFGDAVRLLTTLRMGWTHIINAMAFREETCRQKAVTSPAFLDEANQLQFLLTKLADHVVAETDPTKAKIAQLKFEQESKDDAEIAKLMQYELVPNGEAFLTAARILMAAKRRLDGVEKAVLPLGEAEEEHEREFMLGYVYALVEASRRNVGKAISCLTTASSNRSKEYGSAAKSKGIENVSKGTQEEDTKTI